MDVFPRLLDGDVPFYSHEIDAYWNDIGNLEELREGNVDALTGAVEVEREGSWSTGTAAASGWRASPTSPARSSSVPAARSATTSASTAPPVIGDGVKVGDGARLKRSSPSPEPRSRLARC